MARARRAVIRTRTVRQQRRSASVPARVPHVGLHRPSSMYVKCIHTHSFIGPPQDEAALWTGGQARSTGLGLAGGGGAGLRNHPLALYDKVAREPLPWVHSKRIMTPAAEIIAFFVHEGERRRQGVAWCTIDGAEFDSWITCCKAMTDQQTRVTIGFRNSETNHTTT